MAAHADGDNVGLQTISASTSQFATNFLKVVANANSGNLIISPLSAQVVLAMTAYGARGTTATQMRSVLHIPSDNELGQSGYQSLIKFLNSVDGVELRLANKIYTASQFAVKSTYKKLTAEKFFSASQELDFRNAAGAASVINTWCENQTNKRIKNVVTPGDLDPETKLILVNAVYFKGLWENKFLQHLTQDRAFHINERTTKNVPTMFMKKDFRIGNLPKLDARFIEIPYQGKQLSMIIILPNKVNGLKTVQDNLHELNLSRSLMEARLRKVELFLPKFKIESTLGLNAVLEKLGMINMFTNQADFSGIADISLKVNKVIQKAFIEVNEEGSEAAAVTAVMMTTTSLQMTFSEPPQRFIVDRPYHYAIYHRNTGISLFTGIVQEPKLA